ncbi:hypothetical protein BST36_07855 [Mycolicibacterium moriokaense]|jgi:hypothetical protein|uniref:Transmembrane protein n=1 Tax=Mycolicibacterium moriokaense TaxID=39691 RepID=A0AAD1HEG2_9MYCO|nr:hypothetical protein [Mycolicibacterium moriokaense]MCV7038865.1 hypothetical protein [Mycolicibacterium moriokaense]ORB25456.1 hypothetical protein BST36_07855 [Mycolicibacterium moriokaense]BBX03524.1 hypothetical protein MMOR_44600 [Mycolicibacterium moriokaense]
MSAGLAAATALTFVWLGMVLAISFLEAPLKFRAPGVTLQIGLGIGRLVFRALNASEVVLAVVIGVALVLSQPRTGVIVALVVAAGALIAQLVGVRPLLTRRSNAVLAGGDGPRSRAHYVYVGFEAVKVVALIVGGILLLSS